MTTCRLLPSRPAPKRVGRPLAFSTELPANDTLRVAKSCTSDKVGAGYNDGTNVNWNVVMRGNDAVESVR